MLRIPAQFWCLLPLKLVTMKSVPLPTWRTAVLMFAPAPVARTACALPLPIMQQPVPGRASWSRGDSPTSAVSAMLLHPLIFLILKEFFWRCWMKKSRMRCQIFLLASDESKSFLHTAKDAKDVPRDCSALGREAVIWHSSTELLPGFPFLAIHLETFWMSQGRNLPSDL